MAGDDLVVKTSYEDLGRAVKAYLGRLTDAPQGIERLGALVRVVQEDVRVALVFAPAEAPVPQNGAVEVKDV